jgi:hypothetical protein
LKAPSFLVALGLLGIATSDLGHAQVFDLEHFQCYPILKIDPVIPATVGLRDQFSEVGAPPEIIDVLRANRFCNPARKWHAGTFYGIADNRQHLTFYRTAPESSPLKVVSISNQFGNQTLRVGNAVALALPTRKLPHEAPQGLDHFRCYSSRGQPIGRPVGVADQFIRRTAHMVLDPLLFCNPVEKTHGTVVTPIQHPEAHLTCYSMTRVQFTREVSIRNQFRGASTGDQKLVVGSPGMLCVPTKKLKWRVVPDVAEGAETVEGLTSP